MTGFMNQDGSALVGGLLPSGIGQAAQLDQLGNLAIQPWITSMILQGKGFMCSTGLLNVAAGNYPLCIFNAASGKNVLIYSLRTVTGTNSMTSFMQIVTTNPAFASAATITNAKLGGPASALATTCTFASTSQTLTAPYNQVEVGTQPLELLANGQALLLPANLSQGVVVFLQTYSAGFNSLTARWIEF
ncbi:MAG TPA: hypothetical protein VKY19_12560 [Ktedonosporobacter sp.]|jgi:hypothetical protein|nr:hypothetical protein [Ktedonosporobacter sp.]